MRVAVLEAVCAGLGGESPEPSLLAEGRAMWQAVIDDLLRVPDCTVDTVVNRRWLAVVANRPGLHVWQAEQIEETVACWDSALDDADAALVIAPEFGGALERWVAEAGQRRSLHVLNAEPAAIRLCADKLELARHLQAHDLPTIPTVAETWSAPPTFPCVLKPRDGAGSWLVRRVDGEAEWRRWRRDYAAGNTEPLRQPYVAGRALSVAGWFGDGVVDWLPVGEQRLSKDGGFRYLGGRLPAELSDADAAAVLRLAQSAAATIPGLRGYIGFDILWPAGSSGPPLLVEINPRFTTSYVGYRALIKDNLMERWLARPLPLRFGTGARGSGRGGLSIAADCHVEFDASGSYRMVSRS
uniref:ATP-grasp domain-containing protein n=1 Tax=Schlesneria paludicola TaxID=360056 RepID=A0A7C2K2L1_9PLAN